MLGLQVRTRRADFGQGRLTENLGSDVPDRTAGDFMDEADIPILPRRDPGDDLAPCDFRVNDSFVTAATVIDYRHELRHAGDPPHTACSN